MDDTLFFSPKQEFIDQAMDHLQEQGMDLGKENDVPGYLGVRIETRGDKIKLTQKGLAKRIIEALGANNLKTASTNGVIYH